MAPEVSRLTPNLETEAITMRVVMERERVDGRAEGQRDCYWRYVVTDCDNTPRLQEPIRDPARLNWNEVPKAANYYSSVNAMTKPMQVQEGSLP